MENENKLQAEIKYDIGRIKNKIDSYETLKVSFENDYYSAKQLENSMRGYLGDAQEDFERMIQIRNYHSYELKLIFIKF